ncbi:phosphoenolpyruvate--protein phosphotransferase [Anaeroselena agilis]|uniref:Phosphoenolpyruvate-protein phosphotransferase n=1 Tax=Anaeroselena agilis TaxID=3063788 RepID=A0ABU3P1Y6_9FIRM|nr:phosphoenolpyruvate--protein phosphotransferase [Selenomonadales bacterium 4137-cl]
MAAILKGIGAVDGTAVGKVKRYARELTERLNGYIAEDPAREAAKFLAALENASDQIGRISERARKARENSQLAIMEAHQAMLGDPVLKETVLGKIAGSLPAPKAVIEAAEEYANIFAAMDDDYLRERGADVLDIGNRIAGILLDVRDDALDGEPGIIYARDIPPSVLSDMAGDAAQGLILEHGSTTSHAVIIAKARGIPTVVGLSGDKLPEGALVAIDGTAGEVVVEPDEEDLRRFSDRIEAERQRRALDLAAAALPAVTTDGVRVQLAANIGTPRDIDRAVELGCEGVGLYRSEFLFMDRDSFPTEEEQFAAYRAVAEKCGEHLCIIRTLDVGGDKPLPHLDFGRESNPFLGWRAIRISLDHPEVFVAQLKAVLRAGAYGKVAVMLPMIISAAEIKKAREYLAYAAGELEREGKAFAGNIPLGIMVETPAAAVTAVRLAGECDFFSIGTNDLTQYTLAVDRGNQRVRGLYNHFHPAVLRLVNDVIGAAHDNGIWAGVCGEMAGDPLAAALLVGMGVDELSMNSTALPRVREKIRGISAAGAKELAAEALLLNDGEQIRAFLAETLGDHSERRE